MRIPTLNCRARLQTHKILRGTQERGIQKRLAYLGGRTVLIEKLLAEFLTIRPSMMADLRYTPETHDLNRPSRDSHQLRSWPARAHR